MYFYNPTLSPCIINNPSYDGIMTVQGIPSYMALEFHFLKIYYLKVIILLILLFLKLHLNDVFEVFSSPVDFYMYLESFDF